MQLLTFAIIVLLVSLSSVFTNGSDFIGRNPMVETALDKCTEKNAKLLEEIEQVRKEKTSDIAILQEENRQLKEIIKKENVFFKPAADIVYIKDIFPNAPQVLSEDTDPNPPAKQQVILLNLDKFFSKIFSHKNDKTVNLILDDNNLEVIDVQPGIPRVKKT